MGTKVYDRKNRRYFTEEQAGGKYLKFLYETPAGRTVLKYLISGKTASEMAGRFTELPVSKIKIKPFIRKNKINMDDYEPCSYRSFSEFFVRQIKKEARPVCEDKNALISVADSKVLHYRIDENASVKIKNSIYTVDELAGFRVTDDFRGGDCLVFRLSVDNYHHYCFFDSGRMLSSKYIEGMLHTVSPIAFKKHKVFSENCRVVSVLKTENFGSAVQIEVGALLVGRIKNIPKIIFSKGEEKGWFEMGGSTCVVLLKKGAAKIDPDILGNSRRGIETKVLFGEKIGYKIK